MKLNKELKQKFDDSPRFYLTQATGLPNMIKYQSLNSSFYEKAPEYDETHQKNIISLRNKMRGTSLQIGREVTICEKDELIDKKKRLTVKILKKQLDPTQFRNPNLIKNLHLAYGNNNYNESEMKRTNYSEFFP